jgi:hypothetical protein
VFVVQSISSPERFAVEFNQNVPGAHRHLTPDDVRLMTRCGLIGRYDFYVKSDIQTAVGILRYEQLRDKGIVKEEKSTTVERLCKGCGNPLPTQEPLKKGRPKGYCTKCEPLRSRLRNRKWRKKKTNGKELEDS